MNTEAEPRPKIRPLMKGDPDVRLKRKPTMTADYLDGTARLNTTAVQSLGLKPGEFIAVALDESDGRRWFICIWPSDHKAVAGRASKLKSRSPKDTSGLVFSARHQVRKLIDALPEAKRSPSVAFPILNADVGLDGDPAARVYELMLIDTKRVDRAAKAEAVTS